METTETLHKSWLNLKEHYLNALSDPWYKTLIEIQDVISISTLQFFSQRGLKTLHLPITTHSISSPMGLGSDSMPVQIDLFDVRTYLADSMQFMLEYGCRLHNQGCYYLMPSFRGENADESHLCQFYHSEAEIVGTIDDAIALVEEYLRCMSAALLDRCGSPIASIVGDLSHIEALIQQRSSFPHITMDEAVALLGNHPDFVRSCPPGFRVLTRAGERKLIDHYGGFVWLTEPDHMAVPFYQAFANPKGTKAKAADLLFGISEVVGLGERHVSTQDVYRAMAMHKVDPAPYEWYCNIRHIYPMRTSGFGLGVERYICWLLNHNDVRDCQILPRFNGVVTIP